MFKCQVLGVIVELKAKSFYSLLQAKQWNIEDNPSMEFSLLFLKTLFLSYFLYSYYIYMYIDIKESLVA